MGMPWYEALTILMREGRPVRRKDWKDGIWVEVIRGVSDSWMGLTTKNTDFDRGWRPSHEDLWTEDWETC